MSHGVLSKFVVCLSAGLCTLQAQRLFVAPGAASPGENLEVFVTPPLAQISGFEAGAGGFLVLALPDASKYYVIGSASNQSVTEVDSAFSVPRNIAAFPHPASAAVLSPDGSLLAVAAGNLHLFSTVTDTELVQGGISAGTTLSVIDVAAGLDGKKFYSLAVGAGSSQINEIDIPTHLVTGTIGFHGTATSISVGPNGLIYVTSPNEIIDINPNTFTEDLTGPISINAAPGRPAFTTDGKYALFPNQTPITGSALLLLSLSSRTIVSTAPSLQLALDSLIVTGVDTMLGYASSTQTAYQITIASNGTLGVGLFASSGNTGSVAALAVSNEVPVVGLPFVRSVYELANNEVSELDPQSGQAKSQSTLPTGATAGALSYTSAVVTNSQPIVLLQYGNGQTIGNSTTSLPLVVRVLDANGHPIGGVPVNFKINGTGSSVTAATLTTLSNGYVVNYVNSGVASGPVQVTATAGTRTVVFNFTVGLSGGGTAATLSILSGQGQILPSGFNTDGGLAGTHLSVLLADQNKNPLPNTAVNFLITNGNGALFTNSGGATTQIIHTDSNGVASVDFLAPDVTGNDLVRGFAQTTVVVNAIGTNNVVFTITTTPQNTPATIQQIDPQIGTPITGQVNQLLQGAITYQVISNTGFPMPSVGINLSSQSLDPTLFPTAKCNDPHGTGVLSDGTGTLVCDLALGPHVGTINVTANIGYSINMPPFRLTVTAGPPAAAALIQGNNQSGLPGTTLGKPLVVQVSDVGGNLLQGAAVTWTVSPPGAATLSQIIGLTDSTGRSSAVVTLGNSAGPFTVTATSGSATATFNLAVIVPTSGLQLVSGDGQSTVVNASFTAPLIVEVTGSAGTGVAGGVVNFQVTSGSATIASPTGTSGADGQVSTLVQAGPDAGPVVITATSVNFTVTFHLTVRLPGPTNLTIVNGASFLASTGISPGGIAVITGLGILPGVQGLFSGNNIVGPLPLTLQGVSVTFAGVPAPIYYVVNAGGVEQVAVQVPFEALPTSATAPANVDVIVTASSGSPATLSVPIKPLAPGIFATSSGGKTIPVAQRPDGSFVSANNPAQLGENITLFVTGLGQLSPPTTTGGAGIPGQEVVAPLIIGLNNSGVPLISATYLQGQIGVYAVTFHVPAATATGAAQPLAVVGYDPARHAYFSQGISIPVQ